MAGAPHDGLQPLCEGNQPDQAVERESEHAHASCSREVLISIEIELDRVSTSDLTILNFILLEPDFNKSGL